MHIYAHTHKHKDTCRMHVLGNKANVSSADVRKGSILVGFDHTAHSPTNVEATNIQQQIL